MTNIMYDTHACILVFYTYQLDGFVDPRVDASVAGIEQKILLYFAEGSLVFDSGGVNLLTILQQKIKSRKVLDSYVQHSKMGEHAS